MTINNFIFFAINFNSDLFVCLSKTLRDAESVVKKKDILIMKNIAKKYLLKLKEKCFSIYLIVSKLLNSDMKLFRHLYFHSNKFYVIMK